MELFWCIPKKMKIIINLLIQRNVISLLIVSLVRVGIVCKVKMIRLKVCLIFSLIMKIWGKLEKWPMFQNNIIKAVMTDENIQESSIALNNNLRMVMMRQKNLFFRTLKIRLLLIRNWEKESTSKMVILQNKMITKIIWSKK